MNNGEFYKSNEYNHTEEYMSFPAEDYRKSKEHNPAGEEYSACGEEITTIQAKKTAGEKNGRKSADSFIEKIFNSMKTVATTVSVAVAAFVVTTNIVASDPDITVNSLVADQSSVEYSITVEDMQNGMDYAVLIGTTNEESIRQEVPDDGICQSKIEGLKPSWEYTLSVVEADDTLGDIVYYQTKFQTLAQKAPKIPSANIEISTTELPSELSYFIDYTAEVSDFGNGTNYRLVAIHDGEVLYENTEFRDGVFSGRIDSVDYENFDIIVYATVDGAEVEIGRTPFVAPIYEPPTEYNGNYTLPSLDTAILKWDATPEYHKLSLPIVFEKLGNLYYYIVTALDSDGEEIVSFQGASSTTAELNIPVSEDACNFVFKIYGVGSEQTNLIKSESLGRLSIAKPTPATDVLLTGIDDYRITYKILSDEPKAYTHESLVLTVRYDDGSYDEIFVPEEKIPLGVIDVSSSIAITSVEAVLTTKRNIATDSIEVYSYKTAELDTQLKVSASYNVSEKKVRFALCGVTNGAEHVKITNDVNADVITTWCSSAIEASCSFVGEITYTVYLCDADGNALSEAVTVTVNTDVETPPTYTFNYKNPGDIGVTYNDDGSINLYIVTNFACEDTEVYYQVLLDNYIVIKSTDPVLEIANLPDDNYSVQYFVCKDIDGKQYIYKQVVPSGTANEEYLSAYTEIVDNTLTFTLYYYNERLYDLSEIRFVSSANEEITLSEADFVYDEFEKSYTVSIEFSEEFDSVDVYVMANPSPPSSEITEYKGSLFKIFKLHFE